MPGKTVTIKDIAEYCGVSKSLVGYILNNSCVRQGSPEVRRQVQQAARDLGYYPNLAAKMLVGKSSHLIGVGIGSRAPAVQFRWLRELERKARARDYRLMISENSGDADDLLATYYMFQQYGINGVIYYGIDTPAHRIVQRKYLSGLPNLVFIGRTSVEDGCFVDIDFGSGIRAGAEHFLRSGRKHPALVVDRTPYYTVESRVSGFLEAMAENGFVEGKDCFVCRIDYSPDRQAIRELVRQVLEEQILPNRIDAVLMQNDFYASALLQEAARRNIKVPRDLAVIGFDDEQFTDTTIPPLATIDQQVEQQAAAALDLLISAIENDGKPNVRSIRVPTSLVLRESAG